MKKGHFGTAFLSQQEEEEGEVFFAEHVTQFLVGCFFLGFDGVDGNAHRVGNLVVGLFVQRVPDDFTHLGREVLDGFAKEAERLLVGNLVEAGQVDVLFFLLQINDGLRHFPCAQPVDGEIPGSEIYKTTGFFEGAGEV